MQLEDEQMKSQTGNLSLEDSVLVERCQRGDSTAMETLIVKYQDRLFNVIYKICSDYEDAAELTQETFVKVIEKISSFKGKSSFYTWLFRIAVNLTYNYNKRKFRIKTLSLESSQSENEDGAAAALKNYLTDETEADPLLTAQNKEVREILLYAIGRLSDDHRAAIVLRDIEGMNYIDIAETLETEIGTVKSRIARARSRLREILEELL